MLFKIGLGILLLGWIPLGAMGSGFVDPLDQPAMPVANPAAEPLRAIASAGERLLVAGENGLVAWSDDDGNTWTQAEVPVSVDLNALYFQDERNGWVVGHGAVILHSNDGGEHWHKQLDGRDLQALVVDWFNATTEVDTETAQNYLSTILEMTRPGPDQLFMGIWFDRHGKGYAVGAFGLMMASHDAGKTWWPANLKIDNNELLHLNDILDVDGIPWIVGELGTVWRLDRDQERFIAHQIGYQGTLFGMTGNHERLLVYGLRGNMFESTDAAASWQQLPTGLRTNINTAAIVGENAIVLASQSGQLLIRRHGDAGFSPLLADMGLYSGSLVSAQGRLLLVGLNGIAAPVLE